MPEISRFFGIIIHMYAEAGIQHNRPHFHAYYQNHAAIIALDTIELMAGDLPLAQNRLVLAWAEIHHAELMSDWNLLQSGKSPNKIEPLQ